MFGEIIAETGFQSSRNASLTPSGKHATTTLPSISLVRGSKTGPGNLI